MKKKRSLIAAPLSKGASALIAVCWATASLSAGSDAVVLTFEFTDQKFTPQFIEWVGQFGAKKPFVITDERELSDIIAAECGSITEPNLQLFKIALNTQDVFESGSKILVPPCLPNVKTEYRLRAADNNDRFWDYYKDGGLGLQNVVFKNRPIETYSASNPPILVVDAAFSDGGSGSEAAQYNETTIYDEFKSAVANSRALAGGERDVEAAVANFWERKALSIGSKKLDIGQLAYDAAFLKNTLEQYELDVPTKDIVTAGVKPGEATKSAEIARIVELAETTMSRWSEANFAESANLANQVAGPNYSNEKDFLGKVKWFTPDAKPLELKDGAELRPGDLVVAPTVVTQNIQIPIDESAAPFDRTVLLNVPPAHSGASSESMRLQNRQTFHVDEIEPSECLNAGISEWQQPSFVRMFQDTALRTRLHLVKEGRTSAIAAKVVVADSGFVPAQEEGPFASTLANFGPRDERRQMPHDFLSESQRAHGTAVTGIAIGGPQFWPLASAIGIKFEVIPRRIFDGLVLASGKKVPFFKSDELDKATRVKADIYNLSFGSRNKDAMDVFRRNYFGNSEKLFVIAAGNNNLNDGDKGVDIGSVSIYPQYWAGHESGANVLVVAALDGEELATFSNYSATRVSLAAPGCSVGTWKPSGNDTRYDEKTVTGTSFAAPLVSYVAAIVKALSPIDRVGASWVRARLISSADLTGIENIEHGRVLNPVKAISLYHDVVELSDPSMQEKLVFGRLQWTGDLNDICDGQSLPENAVLLKFARVANTTQQLFHIYYLRDHTLFTSLTCTPRKDAVIPLTLEDGTNEFIAIANVKDVVFRYD